MSSLVKPPCSFRISQLNFYNPLKILQQLSINQNEFLVPCGPQCYVLFIILNFWQEKFSNLFSHTTTLPRQTTTTNIKKSFCLKCLWKTLKLAKQTQTMVTVTSLYSLRTGKYMQMMNILKPIAFDVIHSVSQLFDYYLYAVYTFFGRNDMVQCF